MFIPSPSSCVVSISKVFAFLLSTLVLLSNTAYSAYPGSENLIKSATFLSEKFEVEPGRIVAKNVLDIEIPKGHIGVKSFDAELVDDEGKSVPLYETYLHHWFALKYFAKKNISRNSRNPFEGFDFKRNAGTCNSYILPYHWGKGVESRGTPSKLLGSFAVELGDPASTTSGYEEKWMFNIMVIDTRGAKDKESCTQCKCEAFHIPKNFYNTTIGIDGKLLTPAYKGGIFCCQDGYQCKLTDGFQAPTRKLAIRYKITWVDWNDFQVPVKFYVLDATDRVTRNGSKTIHDCQVDYTIPATNDGSKYHVQIAKIPIEGGGYLIYCTAHMHAGVVNATLYGQDGRTLCTSTPKYGTGTEPGNEKGYNVGMSVTYPEPGSIKINDGETLTLESRYENGFRTGVMGQMFLYPKYLHFYYPTLVLLSNTAYSAYPGSENLIKSATFLSEKFEVEPGRIVAKNVLDIEIPKGHIGVKSFDAELVDDEGNSVPLYETYLHHWFALKYFAKKNISRNSRNPFEGFDFKRNAGTCNSYILPYHWGKGVESRGTPSKLLGSFAVELGDPASTTSGYEEKWMFNIMVIDTRGAKDKESCTQCKCEAFHIPKNFYNTTIGIDGKLLTPAYKGGIFCCQDGYQCKLTDGFQAPTRKLAIRYKITWVDWNDFQVPVKFYVLDATDRVTRNGSKTIHDCQVDYTIPATNDGSKYHVQKAKIPIGGGGYLIYCTAHMHAGVVNATLYGQDGRTLCTSTPKYGTGTEPGNEKGYNVGMSVTYPEPGSIKINDGETLTLESRYENGFRTGVMGQMYIYLAEKLP